MNRFFSLVVTLMASAAMWATVPVTYYSSINGKAGAELKEAVRKVIYPHTEVSSYSALPSYFEKTDVYPQSKRWWDMYSDIPLYAPSFKGLNREHSFPKSWWGGSTSTPAYVDLNHLYPSEAAANQAKSNYPLGVVLTAKFDNGVTKVGYPVSGQGGGASQVFEPDDEYKGDFARTYFYMATCYSNLTWKITYMVQNNQYPTFTPWAQELLLKWSRQDPVSQKEIDRNDKIYQIQNNRNPFIDFPQLSEYIWGNKVGEKFTVSDTPEPPAGDPEIITPQNGMTLDFTDVAIGGKTTSKLFFKTKDFSSDVNVTISGANRAYFTPDSRRISHSLSNGEDGYWLTVTYEPAQLGEHEANLVVYGDQIVGSFTVKLRGACFPIPSLEAPVALAASNIEDDSYLASWAEPKGDTPVDYYVVTHTRYKDGDFQVQELLAEEESLEIEGFSQGDYDTYSVQAVRLGYRSPSSNTITVQHSGIAPIEQMSQIGVKIYEGLLVLMSSTHQEVSIYDMTGRQIIVMPVSQGYNELRLAPGAYIITSDASPKPLKVLVK